INPLANSDKKSALHYMKAYTDAMKKKGIDLYYFIPPDKASVYTEFLPEGISIYDKTRAEDFEDYINKHGGLKNAIFAKQELSSAKERYGDKLYYKQDTHWNYLGSFFGFKALMNVAEPTYKNFDIEVDFEYGKVLTQDLASMMNVRSYFVDDVPVVGYLQGKTFERKTIKAKEDVIAITSNPNSAIKKTVLIVGDSFRNAMIPYFAKVYSKVIAMKRTDYRHGMMTEYDPDIVIFEVLERYIKAIKGFDF
ncbi:MAG: hypothetical protein Q4A25_03370, partial [Candidatus Saccharibacteria bacterium]|nr:hypothetical protein [Candidatus Saccharibacteria bacterium]